MKILDNAALSSLENAAADNQTTCYQCQSWKMQSRVSLATMEIKFQAPFYTTETQLVTETLKSNHWMHNYNWLPFGVNTTQNGHHNLSLNTPIAKS